MRKAASQMDKIIIEGASFQSRVGVSEQERSRHQEIIVDLHVFLSLRDAGIRDDLAATISYVDIHEVVARTIAAKPYLLVEAIAEDLAANVLETFQAVAGLVVRIAKPAAMSDRGVRTTGVEITRMREHE
jgi:dihydroneopterin aldolase